MARRTVNVFSLSFLDAMTCGFGAVVLFYMVINASVGLRTQRITTDRQSEVDLLEQQVLEGFKDLVEIRNSVREVEKEAVVARGLSARMVETLREIQVELATYEQDVVSRKEHINRLSSDLKALEESNKRLSAQAPSEETPGDRVRQFIGDGDRQYLTGLKVGGERILILVDASASMLGDTIVNIIRRRNLPDEVKIKADKWQQAVRTVDWLSTQLPRDSEFQIYTFNEQAGPVLADTGGEWLDAGDRDLLDSALKALAATVPQKGTNLYAGFAAIGDLRPKPDNLILLVDGLPTMGKSKSSRRKVTGKQRLQHFSAAIDELPLRVPVNVIMFPMEGDPLAASAFWKVAVASGGSYMSPAEDWP
jgi:hypothetical protein